MFRYEIENILQTKPKRVFFSGQVKIFQGRQKLQVTCTAGQVVSNVNVESFRFTTPGIARHSLKRL